VRTIFLIAMLAGVFVGAAATEAQTVSVEVPASPNARAGAAVDAQGSLYFTNDNLGIITKITAGVVGTFASGFQHPSGLAFDARGNLYVSDSGAVSKVTPGGAVSSYYTPTGTFVGSTGTPQAAGPITLDGAGNLYFCTHNAGFNIVIAKVTPTGDVSSFSADPETSESCAAIAADPNGNIYYVVNGVNFSTAHYEAYIMKVTSAGVASKFALGTFPQVLSVNPPSAAAGPLTIDGNGNLYVYRYYDFAAGSPSIVRIAPDGSLSQSYDTPMLGRPNALAFDDTGTLYAADMGSNAIERIVLPTSLLSAVLPGARSVQSGVVATVFATILNAGNTALAGCRVRLPGLTSSALTLDYWPTDAVTNQVVGARDQPVSIPANGSQSFVLGFSTSSAAMIFNAQTLLFGCDGVSPAPITVGVNTVDLSFSAAPVTDVIVLSATASGDGIINVPFPSGNGGAFALATANVGAAGPLSVTADTGAATLPVTMLICQSNPSTGACLSTPANTVPVTFAAGVTSTFSIFVKASASVPFDPGASRIFVRFKDSDGASHGSTSVAVRTQ
jgi:sugar lactone lactonase YvrE